MKKIFISTILLTSIGGVALTNPISVEAKRSDETHAQRQEQTLVLNASDKTITKGSHFNMYPSDLSAFDEFGSDISDRIEIDLTSFTGVDTAKPGDYFVAYKVVDEHFHTAKKTIKVTVTNTKKPNLVVPYKKIITKVGIEPDLRKDISAYDGYTASPDKVKISTNLDVSKEGHYLVKYSLTNKDNITVYEDAVVDVIKNDNPIIYAEDITLRVGESFKMFSGYTAVDKNGNDITNKVQYDFSIFHGVETSKPGKYPVGYTVTDSYGNVGAKQITVTVIE